MEIDRANQLIIDLHANLGKVVKGDETSIDLLVVAIVTRGQVLLETVAGEGKTLPATLDLFAVVGLLCARVLY